MVLNRRRSLRLLRRILIAALILPIVAWLGVTLVVKWTLAKEVPLGDLLPLVGQGMFGNVVCAVAGCEAEMIEGLQLEVFADDLVRDTLVSLDIDPRGRVYLAETARQRAGAEDNRSHEYWLMDDLASRTLEDRRAYYEKAIAEGRIEDPDHFTRNSDRIVMLEDEDGDGRADRRLELARWNEMLSGLVAGVEEREGSVWVTSIPSVYRLLDTDGDGLPETTRELVRGFGVKTSLSGHDLHGLAWGPDGKLYFSMGDRGYHVELPDGRVLEPPLGPGRGAVFRMNADGSELEVFATGVRNPQELAFDDHGNLFTGDNNGDGGDKARLVYLVEGGDTGWAMPYQSLGGDYIRGPWVAERLWELQHPTQPAWILPPVAYIGNGPAGLAHYPGLGLPSRYANHFFLCDYGYTNGRSGIWSFSVKPKGATFEMVDLHAFVWSILATDFDFGWDGRMFAAVFDQMGATQSVAVLSDPASLTDPRLAELTAQALETMDQKSVSVLVELLAFPDQRLRLRAQYELAARMETDRLVELARDREADPIARLHALWGLGQIGDAGVGRLAAEGLSWVQAEDPETRAQLARVIGQTHLEGLAPFLRDALRDPSARVRFFAAQSLGALGDTSSIPALFDLIRENDDEDVYLRHAAVWALYRIGDEEAVWERRDDASRAVRLAVLLVLRDLRDSRTEIFLHDADPLLRVEAARAIYDQPIDGAMGALAALAVSLDPAAADDQQTGQALHRRVLGANLRLRNIAGATALARYVADESQLESLRRLALEALGNYVDPPPRDLAMGFYRPLESTGPDLLAAVFRAEGRALVASSLGAEALEIATRIGQMPLDDEELLEIVDRREEPAASRVSALQALAARAETPFVAARGRAAAESALLANEANVRNAARELIFALDAEAGLEAYLQAAEESRELSERQQAWRRLGVIDDDRARERLRAGLEDWSAGQLERAVALEVIQAAARQTDAELASRARALLRPSNEELLESRQWALEGGDADAGELVFQTYGDCQRCHGAAGHGAGVGPDLDGVGRRGAVYVLESIIDPQAQIANGYGSVAVTRKDGSIVAGLMQGEDDGALQLDVGAAEPIEIPRAEIVNMGEPISGMPPIGLGLDPPALRDLVAYVVSLQ